MRTSSPVSHRKSKTKVTLGDAKTMEAKLKHLEFIQAAISRMATNSFLFKGWAITIAAALSAFGAMETRVGLLTIALVSTTMFWALDGYYLWLERGFIDLHKQVATIKDADVNFSMKIDKTHAARRWWKTCWRPHLWFFYGTIIIVDVIGIFLIKSSGADGTLQLQIR
jgi:hypothetical protein